MTDPVSLTFGITSLLQVIAQTSVAVASFVQTCRKARADLLGIDQELSALKKILEWLKSDTEDIQDVSIPESLSDQILTIISHCNGTLKKIKSVLEKHSDWRGPARWALDGKKEVSGLQPELAAYRGALSVALITIDM
jgi:Fungal N-terminal domain of STAND proteins